MELLLDGQIVANSRTDCVQINQALTNCYGLNRPDVARSYSGYVNADNAGFNFSFALVSTLASQSGQIEIRLPSPGAPGGLDPRAASRPPESTRWPFGPGTKRRRQVQIAAMSVDILCNQITSNQPAFGYIDTPSDYQFIDGVFEVFGWACDFQVVQTVQIDVDGHLRRKRDLRASADGCAAHDPRVSSSNVGFSYLLDTTQLSDSAHDLVVYVIDKQQNRSEIGRRKFVVNNNVPTHN